MSGPVRGKGGAKWLKRIRVIVSTLCVCLLAGCAEVQILDIEATNVNRTPGQIPPLSSILAAGANHTKLIMLHGIGDHDPGFAVDYADTKSWLSSATLHQLDLEPIGKMERTVFPVREFATDAGVPDQANIVLTTQSYRYKPGAPDERTIDALEITWSPLTRWLKDALLCYDINGEESDLPQGCRAARPIGMRPVKPPRRDLINAMLKNDTLDRNFPDAILYMGPYKHDILRGVFWALCQGLALERQPARGGDLSACAWPVPKDDDRYIFVTHSLGSRVAYDLILGVRQLAPYLSSDIFPVKQTRGAQPFFQHLHAQTNAFYMMANQLPLLGLTNVPAAPDGGQHPYDVGQPLATGGAVAPAAKPHRWTSLIDTFNDARTAAWRAARRNPKADPPMLYVVAFSDTNDLLTWALPPWYHETDPTRVESMRISNVYVHNAWSWLGIYEHAPDAHSNYFVNPQVWDVMRCGSDAYKSCKIR